MVLKIIENIKENVMLILIIKIKNYEKTYFPRFRS
jgi:hypothetical protein